MHAPIHLIKLILQWLPDRSLIQYRCVSRQWNVVIPPLFTKSRYMNQYAEWLAVQMTPLQRGPQHRCDQQLAGALVMTDMDDEENPRALMSVDVMGNFQSFGWKSAAGSYRENDPVWYDLTRCVLFNQQVLRLSPSWENEWQFWCAQETPGNPFEMYPLVLRVQSNESKKKKLVDCCCAQCQEDNYEWASTPNCDSRSRHQAQGSSQRCHCVVRSKIGCSVDFCQDQSSYTSNPVIMCRHHEDKHDVLSDEIQQIWDTVTSLACGHVQVMYSQPTFEEFCKTLDTWTLPDDKKQWQEYVYTKASGRYSTPDLGLRLQQLFKSAFGDTPCMMQCTDRTSEEITVMFLVGRFGDFVTGTFYYRVQD
eukprot:GILJ01013816.1.p1 GENE.GILJ01013816.1~~GILJ01013816.1.p1  ORF type:complete len:364 (+),score=23.18 GILJ01013816.1:584-1675(+)